MLVTVELEGCDGSLWTLAGDRAGDRGVTLATEVTGLYDPPVKVVYEEPGNYPGARYLNHRILRRDVVFGVDILNDKGSGSWMSRDSMWRKAWAYDRDSYLHITTDYSGTRTLKLRMLEAPDVSWKYDPNTNALNTVGMICVAGDPFWYAPDAEFSVETVTDTTGITDINHESAETLTITVGREEGYLNPTDQYVFPKWIIPAPGKVRIPDPSFEDPALFNRVITMPALMPGEDCVIDTDPRVEQVSAENDAPLWARMNGVRFRHPYPPYTEEHTYQLRVVGYPPGQVFTLRIPRPWSRPWGLE